MFEKRYLGKPVALADCDGCAHFIRWKYLAGKIPCGNPEVKTIPADRPCFVPRGKRREEKPWLD